MLIRNFKILAIHDLNSMSTTLYLSRIETEIGSMVAGVTEDAVLMLEFQKGSRVERKLEQIHQKMDIVVQMSRKKLHTELQQQMEEFFKGERSEFDLPMRTIGTEFQNLVWNLLLKIPAGQTVSYGDVASYLGDYYTPEDVATAAGINHIVILIPCHRLLGRDGSLIGYNGGIDRKKRLLEHEKDFFGDTGSVTEDVTTNVS